MAMNRKLSMTAGAALVLFALTFQANSNDPASPEAPSSDEAVFAPNAFPPTVSDVKHHQNAWNRNDCLRCHETGVNNATVVKHQGMSEILLTAKCRSCHVLIPGQVAVETTSADGEFASFAFPPMMPASVSHREAWKRDNCLLCHETGNRKGAPVVVHEGMPRLLMKAKCRSCHVQVRSAFADKP